MHWNLLFFVRLLIVSFALIPCAYAEEEWTIDKSETMSYARVSGEITHGDKLNFFIKSRQDCNKVSNTFSFYTYEKPGDIKQLEKKYIPIKINGREHAARVVSVFPFLMGYSVVFTMGTFPLNEYIYLLNNMYLEEKKFEIEIVDGLDFKASKYFDIPNNHWKLDRLVPSLLEANKLCKEISHIKS